MQSYKYTKCNKLNEKEPTAIRVVSQREKKRYIMWVQSRYYHFALDLSRVTTVLHFCHVNVASSRLYRDECARLPYVAYRRTPMPTNLKKSTDFFESLVTCSIRFFIRTNARFFISSSIGNRPIHLEC